MTAIPMERVEQRNEFDCGVACLMMLTGMQHITIIEKLGYTPSGEKPVSDTEISLFLHKCGMSPLLLRTKELDAHRNKCHPVLFEERLLHPSSRQVLRMADSHAAAILCLRDDHWVAWNGEAVFDPHPRQAYSAERFCAEGFAVAIICTQPLDCAKAEAWRLRTESDDVE